jgi:hypothetical protein
MRKKDISLEKDFVSIFRDVLATIFPIYLVFVSQKIPVFYIFSRKYIKKNSQFRIFKTLEPFVHTNSLERESFLNVFGHEFLDFKIEYDINE